MNPEALAQALIAGLVTGGLFVLAGAGVALVFGVMRILNFAHGEWMMLGAYVVFWCATALRLEPLVAALVAFVVVGAFGAVVYRLLLARTIGTRHENQLILTLALSIFLANGASLSFGPEFRSVNSSLAPIILRFGPLSVGLLYLAVLVVTLASTAGLALFLWRTNPGRAIRAVAIDRGAAYLVGVDVRRVELLTFVLGSALAGLAGGLLAPVSFVYPTMGFAFTLKAFVVVTLGGMGSVPGAMIGGVILGVTESLAALALPSEWKEAVAFVVFLGVLMLRPAGLFGRSPA